MTRFDYPIKTLLKLQFKNKLFSSGVNATQHSQPQQRHQCETESQNELKGSSSHSTDVSQSTPAPSAIPPPPPPPPPAPPLPGVLMSPGNVAGKTSATSEELNKGED